MAARFWVGGTGTWDASTTTHWAASSGGAGGASVPTATDDVTFDANSGGGVCTIATSTSVNCQAFTAAGFTGSFTFTTGSQIVPHANVNLGGVAYNGGTAGFTMNQTSGSFTFTSGGSTIPNCNFGGATLGATYTLQDALTVSLTLTLSAGTLNTNNFAVSCSSFSSSNSNARTLTLGTSTLTCTQSNGTAWNCAITTNLTLNAASGTISLTGTTPTFNMGGTSGSGLSVGTLSASGAGTLSLAGPGTTFTNLSRVGTALGSFLAISGVPVVTTSLTLKGNSATSRLLVFSSIGIGTQRPLSINAGCTFSCQFVDFQDSGGTGAGTPITGTSMGDCGNNTGVTFDASATQTWLPTTSGNWSNPANWTSRIPLPQDDVIISAAFSAGQTITVDMLRIGRSITCTCTGQPTFSMSQDIHFFGSWNMSGLKSPIVTNGHLIWAEGRGNYTITTGGVSVNGGGTNFSFACPGGSYTLQDTVSWSCGIGLSGGTLNTNNQTITSWNFATAGPSNAAAARTLNMGTTQWSLTARNTTAWFTVTSPTTFNFSPGAKIIFTGAGILIQNNATAIAMPNVSLQGFGVVRITGSASFASLALASQIRGLELQAGQTYTLPPGGLTIPAGSALSGILLTGAPTPASGNYISTPNSAALQITGDIDLRFQGAAYWSGVNGIAQTLIAKSNGAGHISYVLFIDGSGKLNMQWSADGTTTLTRTSTATIGSVFASQATGWVRATLAVNSGGNNVVNFYTSTDGSTWTQLGSTVSTAGTTSIFSDASTVLEIGSQSNGTSLLLQTATVYRAQVYNGIGGTLVFDANTANKAFGANSWTESSSNAATVTVNGIYAQCGDGRFTIGSDTPGSAAFLNMPSDFAADWFIVQDNPADGGGTFYAGPNGVLNTNVTGWYNTATRVPNVVDPTKVSIASYVSFASVKTYSSSAAVQSYGASAMLASYISSVMVRPYSSNTGITPYVSSAYILPYGSTATMGT